ncbi:hypothetical protein H6A18_02820 [Collinsella tanakaei]|uniref:hypothetical protein n=1 Tax=Collinsella tanakaei TaxID=626935 RepID=UPI00195E7737|nr:hypothetical protein [Collinsella tanakaei]MBM6755465.1 hypothetical protein [Collinsella tanakaei]
MRGLISALASFVGIASTLFAPACAWAEMGLKQEVASAGAITYFDFGGIGYAIILVALLVVVLRKQRAAFKRMAENKRKRAARQRAASAASTSDAAQEDLGASSLAAVERLKQAERALHNPHMPAARPHAQQSAGKHDAR